MNNKISLKGRLVAAVLALIMLVTSLLGTTFAWFTDSATSGSNVITAGRLDVNMYWSDTLLAVDSTEWKHADGVDLDVFSHENWEPGYTEVKYVKIANEGSLDLKWQLSLEVEDEIGKLAEVIDVYYVNPATSEVTSLAGLTTAGTLDKVISSHKSTSGTLLEEDGQDSVIIAIAMHMQESAGNEYQAESVSGDAGFKLCLVATQFASESDSFDSSYDEEATFPTNNPTGSASVSLVNKDVNNDGLLDASVTVDLPGGIKATIPAGTKLAEGATQIDVSVDNMASSSNILVENDEEVRSLNVHAEGVAEDNTVPAVIEIPKTMPKGLNIGNYRLYHVENGTANEMKNVATPTDHNDFSYDPVTGSIAVAMATYSEVALVADTVNAWEGNFDYTWYDASKTDLTIANADQLAAFGAIVGGMNGQTQDSFAGKTVKLIADVNLGDKESENNPDLIFYPIGYNSSDGKYEKTGVAVTTGFYNFSGTFDGNGNTIANFYQNTWEMKGDNNYYDATLQYYRDGMGLFGKLYGATVKNLTVDNFSSDGEYTTTGAIAAYADGATFENIAITNCNPRVYNIGNGGIVGCVGWYAKEANLKTTFKNITVDNSNKISALWGSYDVACGGIVGQYYPTSGQTSAGTPANGGVHFENCHVSAQMDVYNDVCANYQYYAYRYAGMIIGSIRENTTNEDGKTIPDMTGISATGCTVNYGDWNDYYYCEFEKNTMASYSEDYQFSRVPHSELKFTDSNGNGVVDADERASVTGCTHTHTAEENHQAIYLPFHQLFTGYGWGVNSIGLEKYSGIVTNLDITEGEQEESVVKFETKFTGDFLYRVGNQNAVSIGSLFKAKDGATINNSGVIVSVQKVDEKSNVSGTFTANTSDWTKGTIKFEGTGVVKVTIQDYNFCTPTVLLLEVVDAKNITKAESASANDVVLLNDISGTFVVSNGRTFYGNGFTVTLPTNSVQEKGQGFTGYVSIGAAQDSGAATGGNLDNVRIVGPEYEEMYLYRSQAEITDKNDPDYGTGNNMRYFRNSVIVYGGNCTISNSYISGCRTPVCLRGGNNVVIENTTLSGGSVANMQVAGVNSLVLRDLTTEGSLGIYVDSSAAQISVEGQLNQYNWITQQEWTDAIGGSLNAKFFPDFFNDSTYKEYQHQYNNQTYVNVGFIFACDWDSSKLNIARQSNKDIYSITDGISVTTPNGTVTGGVYSVAQQILTDKLYNAPEYKSPGFNPVAPKFIFDNTPNADADDTNDANDTYCVYNEGAGTLKIGVSGDSKTLDLSKVVISKNGIDLRYTAYLNGTKISGTSATIKAADGAKQALTFEATSDDAGYDKNGNAIAGSIEYTWTVTIEIATLSFPAPEWNMSGDYKFDATTNCIFVEYNSDYGEAVPIYEGIKVIYYDKDGNKIEKDFSGTTAVPTGSNNSNANAFVYTLPDGSTLTMKYSSGWKSGATTHQFATYSDKVYVYPQSLDNSNYARNEKTAQDFDVKISYTFTDPNGQTISQSMQWYNAKSNNTNVTEVQWKTFDKTNGKEPGCLVEGTLITMADGTQKPVEDLKVGDMIMIFNHVTGQYEAMPLIFNTHADETEAKNYDVLYLQFADGRELKIVQSHGLFDTTLMQYVYIDYDNYMDYIGHEFYALNSDGTAGERVELVNAFIQNENVRIFCPVTYFHMNSFANGFLNTPNIPGDITGLVNYFEYDEDLKYNEEAMQRDIEKYGLYTYDDFKDYISEAAYNSSPSVYLKVAVGKGMITFEEILGVIEYLLSGSLIN